MQIRAEDDSSRKRNSVEDYFLNFLADKRDKELLPGLQNLSARFAIEIDGIGNGAWTLEIEKGKLRTVESGLVAPQCSYRLGAETFLRIAAGELSPQLAFFQRKIEIGGRIDLGLRVATVLSAFFKQFPHRPSESAR
jgi:predicted lipid carrier protein YhbT